MNTQLIAEAVLAAAKLTNGQLHTMILSFLVRDAAWHLESCTWGTFNKLLERRFASFVQPKSSNVDIELIEHLGCGTTYGGILVLESIFKKNFGALFPIEISYDSVDVFREILRRESAVGLQIAELWTRLRLDLLALTKLGVVIAATSCEQVLGEAFPLDTWIH